MKARIIAGALGLLLFTFCFTVPAAQAQGMCRMETVTGAYVFYEKGSSSIFDPNSQPYPFHWAGASAPFVTIGEVTLGPSGVGEGFFWIRVGSFNGGPDSLPLQIVVTEMNEDCSGKLRVSFTLPGNPAPTIVEERFIAVDNGRELRFIPTSIVNGLSTEAWVGEAHRISKPGEPLYTCGPQTAHGTYVMAVENLVRMGTNPILSDALLLRLDISMTGDYTGMLYEKLGPTGNIELPVWGTMSVNPDCSFATTLNFSIQGVPKIAPVRGIFFDQGKNLFVLNVNVGEFGTRYSFGEGQRISP
jgi:hypothetical protein